MAAQKPSYKVDTWLRFIVKWLDQLIAALGKSVAWLTLLMVVATGIVVVLRRGFDIGSIGLQESVTYMHAAVFLLGAAYALQRGAQVRVDILYRRFSAHNKAWVDSLGALIFLLPVSAFIGFISWDFVLNSWQISEISTDSGGLRIVYLLKSLIPIAALSLCLQAVAEVLRNLLVLMGSSNEEIHP
jgi:TRAP-type mannitol/chloroaromatic compound transport system permease small subunit